MEESDLEKLKRIKKFLLIFCLILSLSFNFNLMQVFATEPNLNPPSSAADQPKTENQNVPPQNPPPVVKKPITYRKTTTVRNNYPQQSNVANFNNSNQNLQQTSPAEQNVTPPEQQQNVENTEEIKKDKKEISKNVGEFLATYPEKFNWEKFVDDENFDDIEDKDEKPKDLPEAKDEEIVLPEVITASETKNESSVSLFAGIVAWSCILAGIGIILFVLFMNKRGGEFPVDSEKSKKRRKLTLARKYYKGNF